MSILIRLLILILFLLSIDCTKLICHRHYNLAGWLSFNEQNNSSFILKCREDISKSEKNTQIPSQITIVSINSKY